MIEGAIIEKALWSSPHLFYHFIFSPVNLFISCKNKLECEHVQNE